MVQTLVSTAGGTGSVPSWGTKITCATQRGWKQKGQGKQPNQIKRLAVKKSWP